MTTATPSEEAPATAPKTRPSVNGSVTAARIAALELKLTELAWYHAELSQRFQATAATLAAMLAQQMQPQVQQAILQRLMG